MSLFDHLIPKSVCMYLSLKKKSRQYFISQYESERVLERELSNKDARVNSDNKLWFYMDLPNLQVIS